LQHSARIFPQKQMKQKTQKQGSENVSLADKRALDSQRIRRVPQGRIKVLRPFASTSESNGVSAGFPILAVPFRHPATCKSLWRLQRESVAPICAGSSDRGSVHQALLLLPSKCAWSQDGQCKRNSQVILECSGTFPSEFVPLFNFAQ
jgi:hypothetical protein